LSARLARHTAVFCRPAVIGVQTALTSTTEELRCLVMYCYQYS
jgi:hypothetical protein